MTAFYWTVLILMLCRTSHTSEDRDTKDLKLERVFVLCPNITAQEVLFKLSVNWESAGNVTCNTEKTSPNCSSLLSSTDVTFEKKAAAVGFELRGARAKADATYKCVADKKYPPPYHSSHSERWFLVFHEETRTVPKVSPRKEQLPWVWVTVVALLSTYSLAVTITAFVLWFKLKDVDSQNDYMNTKPQAPRNRVKKRGLQNPTPKYV